MSVYIKETGVSTDYIDLTVRLKNFLILHGYNLEYYSDNIQGGNNYGKRLHFSKNSVFYNFALSLIGTVDNANPLQKEISANVSLSLNTSLSWYSNNPTPDIVRAEISSSCNYFFYVNDKNIIIIIKFGVGKYSMLSVGEADAYNNKKYIYQASTGTNYSSTTQSITQIPLFKTNKLAFFIDNNYYNENKNIMAINHFNNSGNFPNFSISTTGGNTGLVNKSDNIFNGTSILMPIKIYTRLTIPTVLAFYQPSFTFKNIFMINFKNHTAEQNLNLGTNSYDVFPFSKKEIPQIYSNTENYGMGIAIKVGE